MHLSSLPFSRTLIAASLIGMLAACGGSSSDPKADTNGQKDPPSSGVSQVLPKLYIQTEAGAPVVSKEDYLNATVRIDSENAGERLEASTKIRGRGNTTWTEMPKKPYRLKFDEKQSVLGMPADRSWALLANYADKSMVRNKLAMELGKASGLSYNPRSKFVELYLNDEYQGVYELFEHRAVGPNKVAIEEMDPSVTELPELSGGYFIEADWREGEEICWASSFNKIVELGPEGESDPEAEKNITFCAKDPEWKRKDIGSDEDLSTATHSSAIQYKFIKDYIYDAETSMRVQGNGYKDFLDVDSAVNWYLVNELLKNNDAYMHSSVFLHKPRNQKLFFGPLWDFDLAAGNINYNNSEKPEGWHVRNSLWHQRLFDNTDFGEKVFDKWCELKKEGVISGLEAKVDEIASSIEPAAIERNFTRWPILGVRVEPNHFVGNTYAEEVDYLKSWLQQRAKWMDQAFAAEDRVCKPS